ncbi:hypothetical protein F2Q69_00012775 [Brassica cretica]|uniref:Uncharacterized protein n=1 Tax=Brassica cretica TaxID=69181 RepID=A0A8S9QX30_BRACR|nr:hypothetical protein F2Q69_00012775 [Brassica cretica]
MSIDGRARWSSRASRASSFTPTQTSFVLHRLCRAVTLCRDLEDLSRGSQRQHSRLCQTCLHALRARVSRCRCSSRRSVRASSPSAEGPSRQRRGDSEETTDETTDKD